MLQSVPEPVWINALGSSAVARQSQVVALSLLDSAAEQEKAMVSMANRKENRRFNEQEALAIPGASIHDNIRSRIPGFPITPGTGRKTCCWAIV
jgi:hypothetical protein